MLIYVVYCIIVSATINLHVDIVSDIFQAVCLSIICFLDYYFFTICTQPKAF